MEFESLGKTFMQFVIYFNYQRAPSNFKLFYFKSLKIIPNVVVYLKTFSEYFIIVKKKLDTKLRS